MQEVSSTNPISSKAQFQSSLELKNQAISDLEKRNENLEQLNKNLGHDNEVLRNLIKQLKRQIFEKKSERLDKEQLGLFNEAEEDKAATAKEEEQLIKVGAYEKARGKRKALPEQLPRERVLIELCEEDRKCPCCLEAMKEIGEEVSEKLDIIPAQAKVIETVKKKYACGKVLKALNKLQHQLN